MTIKRKTNDGTVSISGASLLLAIVCSCLSFPAASEGTPEPGPNVDNELVSWLIVSSPLRDVLQQLGEQAGFDVTVSQALPVQLVSLQVNSLPLDQVLEKMLREQNYIIDRSVSGDIQAVHLFAVGESADPGAQTADASGDQSPAQGQKLIADMIEELPPGTLTQEMKDALIHLSNPPSEEEIAELKSRQEAIFEEFKANFGKTE